MMKKVLSLILVAVLLLGVLPATAFAQTAILEGYTLSLGDSIAIEFYAQEVSLADFQKIVFYKNDTKVQEITACPAAEASGRVYFKFDKLGPHEMDASIKAELYLTTSNEPVQTQTVSVLNYCTAMLSATDEKLKKLIVNMLYYGAEAETYTSDANAGIAAYIDTLDDATKALREEGEVAEAQLKQTLFKDTPTATVSWTAATLVLNAGIVPSFTFTTGEAVSGLTAVATCGGKVWRTSSFTARGTDTYSFDFTGLNPSQLRSPIYVEIRDAQDNVVSDVCAFTAEYYTAKAAEAEKALANAMMNYGSAARDYVLRDVSAGLLTADEQNALKAFAGENQMEFKNLVADAYASAGIDIAKYIPYEPWFDLADNFFYTKTVNPESDAMDYQLRTDMKAPYSYMLLPGYYGGYRHDTDKLFSADDFRVGDLFFGTYKCSGLDGWNYVAGIYQGDGKFLLYDAHPATHTECTSGIKTEIVSDTSTMISGNADVMNKYALYYVLRPQLATHRDITSGALTQLEMDAIASYETDEAKHLNIVANNAYAGAGVDISAVITKHVNKTRELFMNEDCTLIASPDANMVAMLMPGYYGGSKNAALESATNRTFVPADFKVGDLFCAFSKSTTCSHGTGTGWKYFTGIYQGEGKFLVSCVAGSCADCNGVYEDVYGATLANGRTSIWSENATDLNNAFMFYYVLRPERLAADSLKSISLNKTELTVTQFYSETLTVTGDPAAALSNVTWSSSNEAVAKVDQNGLVTYQGNGTATITAKCEGYTASCQVTAAATRDITSGALTEEEKTKISSFVPVDGGKYTSDMLKAAYAAAGIDISGYFGKLGFNDIADKMFYVTTANPNSNAKDYSLKAEPDADFAKMLVSGYHGGRKTVGRAFQPEDFQVGDLFIGYLNNKCATHNKGLHIWAVYQGNGKFMVSLKGCDCAECYTDENGVALNNISSTIWGADADAMESAFAFYFVLRPSNLAN